MLKDLQHGKTIDALYEGAHQRQATLEAVCLRAAVALMFASHPSIEGCSDAEEFQATLDATDNSQEKIEIFNTVAERIGFGLRLYSTGHKTKERALKKIASHHMEPWQLSDIQRISITGDSPELLDAFAEEVTRTRRYARDGWNLRASGILGSGFRIEVDGAACQVHLGEQGQIFNAERVSHKLYTVMRLADECHDASDDALRQTIIDKYNHVAHVMRALGTGTFDETMRDILSPRQFETVQHFILENQLQRSCALNDLNENASASDIRVASEALLGLHQIIHASFIVDAPEAWRNLYVAKARACNHKLGLEMFPEALLRAIPHQEAAVREMLEQSEKSRG